MKELDVSGFISELNSILRDEKSKKPVRITIKKYYPDVRGCKRKRKEMESKKTKGGEDECQSLVRLTDGKRRRSRVVIRSKSDSSSLVSDLARSLVKSDAQRKGQKMNTR